MSEYKPRQLVAMTKRGEYSKRPQGRPPAGAVLVDGKWQLTDKSKEITTDCSFITEGSKITSELSDFLKGTGRDTSGYY